MVFGLQLLEHLVACSLCFWIFLEILVTGKHLLFLKDSITVEVIERGSAVHCISAYATRQGLEVQGKFGQRQEPPAQP